MLLPIFRQIGLGSNMALDTITVPTEVVLWRSSPRSKTNCINVSAGNKLDYALNYLVVVLIWLSAGGDLTAFTVERIEETNTKTIDLLMCGNGQWGGLGGNSFTNAQGNPLRAKNVSGLLECKMSIPRS
jgi:hypothetical protein